MEKALTNIRFSPFSFYLFYFDILGFRPGGVALYVFPEVLVS
jgi:hypothetical protein